MLQTSFCNIHIPNWEAVRRLLDESEKEKRLSNFGPLYRRLQARLKQELNLSEDRDVCITTSGHTALMAAYACLGCKSLAVSDYTFESTRCAATLQGISTLSLDVDIDGFFSTINASGWKLDSLCITAPLSMIPPTDRYVNSANKGKKLIFDMAATWGSNVDRNLGDAQCISLHATKSFPAGECGILIAHPSVIQKAERYINFGRDASGKPVMPGLNGKVSEYTCAIVLVLLDEIQEDICQRREKASFLKENLPKEILPQSYSTDTIYASFPIFMPTQEQAIFAYHDLKKKGIDCYQYYKPLTGLPIATNLYNRNICIPCHPDVSQEALEMMVETIKDHL